MSDTLTIIVSVAGLIAAATGVTLTVTMAMIRMLRNDVGRRIDDTNAGIADLRAETRDAHAQIGKRIDDTNAGIADLRAETRDAHAQIGKRIDDTNARITEIRADFRALFPRSGTEGPDDQ